MKLLSLEAENVFSIGHIVISLNKRGLLLVTGYSNDDQTGNGAGKSSVANHAIVWGLYGQTYDGTRGDVVVNRNSDSKSGSVKIKFQSANGQVWEVIRTRNPNSLRLFSSYYREYETNTITEPFTDCSHKLEKETQKQIDHLLGRDFNTFIQADLLGPGTERSFFRLTGAEQVEIIESLLPMSNLDVWATRAKGHLNDVETKSDELESKLTKLSSKIETLQDRYKSLNTQNDVWYVNNKAKSLGISKALESLCAKQADKDRVIAECEEAIARLSAIIPGKYKDGTGDLSADRATVERQVGASQAKFNSLTSAMHLQECDRCGQEVSEEHRKDIASERLAEGDILNELLSTAAQIQIYVMCRRELRDKQTKVLTERAQSYEVQIEATRQELARNKEQESPFHVELNNIDKEVHLNDQEALRLQLDLENLLDHKKWLEFWAHGFSKDIKTMMIEEICPFLETRINGYLKDLGNPQFKAKVSTVKSLKSGDIREKFNLEIQSDHGANSFDLLSVGEKQMVSFAASLAVADLATTQVGGRSNILILDEPFMGLHKNNCDKIINFLNSSNIETILLISNEDNLKSMVPNRVHVVKTKGKSWLE